jgi:hypothetical protein
MTKKRSAVGLEIETEELDKETICGNFTVSGNFLTDVHIEKWNNSRNNHWGIKILPFYFYFCHIISTVLYMSLNFFGPWFHFLQWLSSSKF